MAKEKQKPGKSLVTRQPWQRSQNLPASNDDIFAQPFVPGPWRGIFGDEAIWAPAIDVQEKEDKFVAKVELPGVTDENVSVSVMGDILVVEGQKEKESEVKKKGYYYSEAAYGSFSRSITIPSIVDTDKITANFDKGVLEIDLPKAAGVKPKKVSVTTQKKPKTAVKEEKVTGDAGKAKK